MFVYSFSITIAVFSTLIEASEDQIENYEVGKHLNDLTQEDQVLIDGKAAWYQNLVHNQIPKLRML